MIAAALMLNSLSLNHDKSFIWPTPRQTVCQVYGKLFVSWSHDCAAFSLAHIVKQTKQVAVLDLVSKFEINLIEFSSYNKPIIMTYLCDKQIVRPSEYMEACHLQGLWPFG